jgi:hypothetical protein
MPTVAYVIVCDLELSHEEIDQLLDTAEQALAPRN